MTLGEMFVLYSAECGKYLGYKNDRLEWMVWTDDLRKAVVYPSYEDAKTEFKRLPATLHAEIHPITIEDLGGKAWLGRTYKTIM